MMAAALRPGTGSSSDNPVKSQSEIDLTPVGHAGSSPPATPPASSHNTTEKAGPGTEDPEAAAAPAADQHDTTAAAAAVPSSGTVRSPLDAGYRPWKVVLGCFCLTVPTYGLLSAIGLFQTYWHAGILGGHSEGDVAWIISVFGFLGCLFAAPAGVLFDRYGAASSSSRCVLLPLGCVAYVAAFVGLAWCRTYAQFMGCMVVAGVAAATPTTIAFSVVSQWFDKRKGLATGCVTLGAPIGGIFFSLALQILFDRYPWKTAALVLVGMMAAFLALGCLLVETNLPSLQGAREDDSDMDSEPRAQVTTHMLSSPKFWFVSYALFAYELVLFIQWGSIPSYAVAANVGNKQFYLMMSYNIGAVLGRTLPPWLSDRLFGPLNAILAMNVFTLLTVLAIWLPLGASSIAALFVVVVLMGIGTGSFVPLGVSCINALCRPENTGTWLGSAYSLVSVATLIGNPVSAVILARYQSNGLLAFLAAVLFSGMISAAALRWLSHGRRWILKARA